MYNKMAYNIADGGKLLNMVNSIIGKYTFFLLSLRADFPTL